MKATQELTMRSMSHSQTESMTTNTFGCSKPLSESVLRNSNRRQLSFNVGPIHLLEIGLVASMYKFKVMGLVSPAASPSTYLCCLLAEEDTHLETWHEHGHMKLALRSDAMQHSILSSRSIHPTESTSDTT